MTVIFSVLLNRQRSTFPGSLPPSIIDAKELNFCVRHGYRWFLLAIITGLIKGIAPSKLNNVFDNIDYSIVRFLSFLRAS